MKKSILNVLFTVILTGTAVMFAACSTSSKQDEEKTEVSAEGEEVVYACPMHPEITGKKGDTCSKCHMDLEEVSHDEHHEH